MFDNLFTAGHKDAPKGIAAMETAPYADRLPSISNQEQLSYMMNSVPDIKGLNKKGEWVVEIQNVARSMGLYTTFHVEKAVDSDVPKEYLVFSTKKDLIEELVEGKFKDFPEWLEAQKNRDRGTVLLDRVVFSVTELDRFNYFSMNSEITRYLRNMAIPMMAFENQNLPIPDHVSTYVVNSIWELDKMRSDTKLPLELRERYQETYKSAVAQYSEAYADKYKLEAVPHKGKHQVKESYFRDNHIPVAWDVVDDGFYKFIKSELKAGKYPDFIFYKPDNAFLKIKNLAAEYEKRVGDGQENYWSKDTGKTKYHICVPLSQYGVLTAMRNDYNTRDMESKVSISELTQHSTESLQMIYLHQFDLPNWNSLCATNGVVWSLQDGSYGNFKMTFENALEKIPVLYRHEDNVMVSAIVDRLAKESREYVPMSQITRDEFTNVTKNRLSEALHEKQNKPKSKDVMEL